MSEPMWVHLCVWDPNHTLTLLQSQKEAVEDGTIAGLVKKHGRGAKLREVMREAKLTTMHREKDGELRCVECDALMDELVARDGIVDKVEAVRDIVQNFDEAVQRTIDVKRSG